MAQRRQLGAGWIPQLATAPAAPSSGGLLYVKSDGVLYTKNVAGTEMALNPTGTILTWPTATPPSGYLLCSGGTFSSTTYPNLATVVGDTYGTHAGTTYYLPNLKGHPPDIDWTALPYGAGGWTDFNASYQGGQYRRYKGMVELRGVVKSSGVSAIIAVLPAGCRHTGLPQIWSSPSDSTLTRVDTENTGYLRWQTGATAWVSLSVIKYQAEDATGTNYHIIKT